ncbi:MAG: hypothetical protein K2X44_00855, partial [Magnetospirillum sp.]|nr:hypothetical protein [Magnetospirillum sp.]
TPEKLTGCGFWRTIVIHWDSDNPTAAERVRFYSNRRKLATTSPSLWPNLSDERCHINQARRQNVGNSYKTPLGVDAFITRSPMAEYFFFDGVNLDPVLFDEPNIHGELVPKAPAVVLADYGLTGYRLDFSDPAQPGKDISGKGNHYTAANIATSDILATGPTNVFAALSAADKHPSITLTNANRTAIASNNYIVRGTIEVPADGQWAWETTFNSTASGTSCGITLASNTDLTGAGLDVAGTVRCYGPIRKDGVVVQTPGALANGDVVGTVCDMTALTLQYYRNGVAHGAAVTIADGTYLPMFDPANTSGVTVNFGERPFAHSYGALPICTANLPEPEIKDPAEAFADEIGTGVNILALLDAATAHWGGAAYVEIIKRREALEDWRWRFSDDAGNGCASNNANAKTAAAALVAGGSYIGLRLRVGAKYGVWTAEVAHVNGVATTVTHGLATARTWVMATRVSAGGGDRFVRHPDLAAGKLFKLNATGNFTDATVTSFGANSLQISAAAPSGTYRVVVLAERAGFMHLGKYGGNGAAAGAVARANLSPDLVLIKDSTDGSTTAWHMALATLTGSNQAAALYPNTTAIESAAAPVDLMVGGAQMRHANGDTNQSGRTYCTLQIGRPIGGVCVAPATAR